MIHFLPNFLSNKNKKARFLWPAPCLKENIHDGDGYQDSQHEAKPLEDLCKDITSLGRENRTNRVVYPKHEGKEKFPTEANDSKDDKQT